MAALLSSLFPEKAPELLAYQASIVRAERNFDDCRWVAYDRCFRREAHCLRKTLTGQFQMPDSLIRQSLGVLELFLVAPWHGGSASSRVGMAYFFPTPQLLPGFSMASDASGHGMVWAHVVQVQWSAVSLELPIAPLPILISGVVWGHGWYGHRIECLCDNQAVITCLQSRTSRHRVIMHLLRNLFFIEAILGSTSTPNT